MSKTIGALKKQITFEFNKAVREVEFRKVAEWTEQLKSTKKDSEKVKISAELDELFNSKTIIESNQIELVYPGKKTRFSRDTNRVGATKEVLFDYFVNLRTNNGTKYFSHQDIIKIIYQQSRQHISDIKLYYDLIHQIELHGTEFDIENYQQLWNASEITLSQLVEYLTWVGIKEDFNYPSGEGRTRCFDMYIEAVMLNDSDIDVGDNDLDALIKDSETLSYEANRWLPTDDELYLSKSVLAKNENQ
jgi:hypothetical protein